MRKLKINIIFSLVLFFSLPIFSFITLGIDFQFSLRRIRIITPFHLLMNNRGRAFNAQELANQLRKPVEEVEAELEPWVRNIRVVKVVRDKNLIENKGLGNVYLIPREKIVDDFFQKSIQEILNLPLKDSLPNFTTGLYVLNPLSVVKFIQDLSQLKRILERDYRARMEEIFPFFIGYVFPELIHILGDDLESIISRTFEILEGIQQQRDLLGELTLSQLKEILKEKLEETRINKKLREEYNSPPGRVLKELSEIVLECRKVLPDFIRLGEKDYGVDLKGMIIFGSWARGVPTQYTDLDVLTISQKEISVDFLKFFGEKLKFVLGKRVNDVHTFYTFQINLDDLSSFERNFSSYFEGSFSLYIRNFIIIAKDELSLQEIWKKIVSVQPGLSSP
ncbi:MAG: nucleotidyltransferase domain-containing protein [Candidatus Omnitrophica bacterium]|nr:nucleotidyltransferase domain-containing protein [Candidatus Omnitrophota bacterium]